MTAPVPASAAAAPTPHVPPTPTTPPLTTPAATVPGEPLSFTVDPAELDAFVSAVAALRTTMDRHVGEFAALALDDDVFGRLPGISSKVHDAYADHVTEGTTALAEGRQTLADLVEAATATVEGYRATERANLSLVDELVRELDHLPTPTPPAPGTAPSVAGTGSRPVSSHLRAV